MLIRILQDYAPMRYEFVSTQQIEQGKLADYQVLLMPLSQAVGRKEAEAIRRFAQRGGLVIADVRPGITDEHGKFAGDRTLRELFGVDWKKELGRKKIRATVSGEYRGVTFENEAATIPVDPAVILDGAKAVLTADGIPLVLSHQVGQGTAVCLNIPFNFYARYPTPDTMYFYLADHEHSTVVGNVLKAIFAAHQIEQPLSVDVPDGGWPWGLETWYATDGDAQYAALTKRRGRKHEPDYTLVVHAPREGHVYDVLRGKYLGQRQRWEATVAAADIRLFSILPYAVERVSVECESTAARGGAIAGKVVIQTGDSEPARHVVHLETVRPDGCPVRYLARNLETDRGAASFCLPLAWNEPPGKYTLTFTDVATKVQSAVEVRVE
jgi:hypothetical protein